MLARTIRRFSSGRNFKAFGEAGVEPPGAEFLGNEFPIPGRFAGIPGMILSKTAHSSNYWCRLVVWTTDRAH